MLRVIRWVVVLASLSITTATVTLPIYTSQFKISGIGLGSLLSVSALMTALSRPLVGRAIDLHGRKQFLVLGVFIMLVANVVFAFSDSITQLFIASTLHGFAWGTILLSSYAITSDLAMSERRAGSFGLTEESQYRGGFYGILIMIPILIMTGYNGQGMLTITPYVWRNSFLIYAIGAVVALFLSIRHVQETYGSRIADSVVIDPSKIGRRFYALTAIVFLTSASVFGIQPLLLKFISDHITSNLALLAMAYAPAAIALGTLPSRMGRISDKYGRKYPIMFGLGASAIFSLVVPFLTSIVLLMLFATVESICYSAAVPAEQALVADLTGDQKRGTGFGLYTLAQSMGKMMGYMAMGAIYDWFPQGPFVVNVLILAIGIGLVWLTVPNVKIKPTLPH